jgi:hypothetical protein
MITQAELKNLFDYVDGQLVAKTDSNKRKAGNALRSITGKGYLSGRINGRTYRVHRLVFLYFHGFMPPQIDHIDGNRQNNQIENLRKATSAQNNQNRVATGATKIKGVVWHKQSKKWVASICINRKSVHLGSFEKIEDAAKVATDARKKLHGEFAKGNT